jgi:hypothetical protein
MLPQMRVLAKVVGAILLLLVAVALLPLILDRHGPTPVAPGPEAEALAQQMLRSVDADAWARTGAVRWRFFGHQHLWDRGRGLVRVRWGRNEALLDIDKRDGMVFSDDREVIGPDLRKKLLDHAYAFFINDMFWLNPVVKAFDPGTARAGGEVDGRRALEVSYSQGGLTPGDRYLWIVDEQARPVAWRLWVKVIPVGGLELGWSGWQKLATGAWVSTEHRMLGIPVVRVRDVAGAATLSQLEPGPDPFAPMFRK